VWSSIHRLKQLEEENAKLKRLVADLSLEKTMQVLRPAVRREMVCHLHGLSDQRTAGLLRHRV
jgi:hypothetical protein